MTSFFTPRTAPYLERPFGFRKAVSETTVDGIHELNRLGSLLKNGIATSLQQRSNGLSVTLLN